MAAGIRTPLGRPSSPQARCPRSRGHSTISYRNTALGVTAQSANGTPSTFLRTPDGTLVGLRTGTASSGNTAYYLFDALGSVAGLVGYNTTTAAWEKRNSYSYDPYGKNRSKTENLANPYEYTGGYLDDSTGFYKLGIRYYDPMLGRFNQSDPTGLSAHYTYAADDPVDLVDATGAYVSVPSGYSGNFCTLSPDMYTGGDGVSFKGPCAYHDICYGGIGLSRLACDQQFLGNLKENCREFSAWNPLRYDCYSVAYIYFRFVRALGEGPYDGP